MNPILPIEYLVLVSAGTLVAGGLCAWRSSELCSVRTRWAIAALRLAALAVLALIAVNPGRWKGAEREQTGEWAILLDASQSMGTADVKGQSRWSEACRLADRILASQPSRKFRLFTFSSHLNPVAGRSDLAAAKCDGATTDILGAGRSVLDVGQSGDCRLEGIILLSDGRQIEAGRAEDFVVAARAHKVPVYPVPLGGRIEMRDLALGAERRQYIAFKEQPLKIAATVTHRNLDNIAPKVQLLNAAGQVVQERKVSLAVGEPGRVEFEVVPKELGYHDYTLKLDAWEGESLLLNNACKVGVSVLEGRLRVLMVEGMPYWDSKFLVQLFQKQKNIVFTTVFRLSADKFFSVAEGDDRPETGRDVFPEDVAAFRQYDLVVLGKGIEYFLTPERIRSLTQYMREYGGGVVFARGKPYSGQLPELAGLEPVEWGTEWEGDFRWQPTTAGVDVGLFTDTLPGAGDPVWQKLPALSRASQCLRTRAFTQVLAEGVSGTGDNAHRFPAVLSQRYGKGLIVVVNSDGLWQWDFFPSFEGASRVYRNFWTQLLQWIVTYADFLPGQNYSLRLSDASVCADQPVIAKVACRSSKPPSARPIIRVLDGNSVLQEVATAAPSAAADQWEGIFSVHRPGTYRVELIVPDDGTSKSASRLYETLHVRAPASEKDDLSVDPAFLEALAVPSGGKVIGEEELGSLFAAPSMPLSTAGENAQWQPRWDHGGILAVCLLFLSVEWYLRRRNGLI